ncbi:hypothetical protein SAMN05444389_102429 [Paracoccus solventivorans]|uniref:Uncharacterized protein n=1 Tax=Paracoccus solventivorans TaxID=53463 RepID=A0A1M7F043_9RHOB|nr:hypothetical protein [Paracoccus solventivorans]SHL97108.1 hypothetical protein SAMN05444389_102429 [Paracoccus solventivorans]
MCDAARIDVSTLSEPELIALRDLLDQLIPVADAAERAGGGGYLVVFCPRHSVGLHHPFNRGSIMMRDIPARRIVHCDDAPVSTSETEAEAKARMAAVANGLLPVRELGREIARSALDDLPEEARAKLLADMLCDLRGPAARDALVTARNRITHHLHDLITAEYDAELTRMSGRDVAELARDDTPGGQL